MTLPVTLATVSLYAGCGASDLEIAPAAVRLAGRKVAASMPFQAIRLPADEPFNIHVPASEQRGEGQAMAEATPDGKAICKATCGGSGMATASFQLGHKFDLTGMQETSAIVRVSLKGHVAHTHTGEDLDTAESATLTVFVKDTRGAVLAKQSMLLVEGRPSRTEFQRVTQFDVTLRNNLGYYVVVGGTATASASESTRASAELAIESAAIELSPNRAPASAPTTGPASRPAGE